MIDTVVRWIMITPVILSIGLCVLFWLYCVFGIFYAVFAKSYKFIDNIENIFAPSSTAGQAFMASGIAAILAFMLYHFAVISMPTFAIFFGITVFTSSWYLIFVVDGWYDMYQQYRIKKEIKLMGK